MKGKKSITALAIVIALSLSAAGCADRRCPGESKIRELYRHSKDYNETAAFLAGLKISQRSPLYRLTLDPRYAAYRDSIGALWEQYRKKDLDNIEKWRRGHVHNAPDVIMYPFSGPDILNALAFFPGAEEFVMIGLEIPGASPDPFAFPGDAVYTELWKVKTALRTILQLNLFRTAEMHVDLKPEAFSGITGIMMFFLARYGYDILDVRRIYIDRAGACERVGPALHGPGCRGRRGRVQEAGGRAAPDSAFFQHRPFGPVALGPPGLLRVPGGEEAVHDASQVRFISPQLRHVPGFTIISPGRAAGTFYRRTAAFRSSIFPRGEWKISLYGTYRLLPIFANRFQRDLDTAIKTGSKGPLPFSFGYGFDPEKSNLMIAEPVKKL